YLDQTKSRLAVCSQLRHAHHHKMNPSRAKRPWTFLGACLIAVVTSALALAQSSSKKTPAASSPSNTARTGPLKARTAKRSTSFSLPPSSRSIPTAASPAKGKFLASTKDRSYQPAEDSYEDIRAEVYDDTAVTLGIFRVKETQNGKRITQRQ